MDKQTKGVGMGFMLWYDRPPICVRYSTMGLDGGTLYIPEDSS